MKKRESGQAFILVIILLALGALLIGPALRLTSTTLLSSAVADQKTKELYAADAGQEYVMWKLLWQDYAGEFDAPNEEDQIEININGIPVTMTVVMRAVVGTGTTLFSDRFKIKPSKTVSYSTPNDGSVRDYTYTIKLENLTLTSQALDCVYDILPSDFGNTYQPGSSQISVDGGAWEAIPDPARVGYSGRYRLRWPASGTFDSTTGTFDSGQVKEIRFQMTSALSNKRTYYNWVVIQQPDQADPVVSGPVAPLVTSTGDFPRDGGVVVSKTAWVNGEENGIAIPGQENDVEYVVTITNLTGNSQNIETITDYLPPEFYYVGPTSGNLTTANPSASYEEFNGIWRWKLVWDNIPPANKSIAADPPNNTKTLSFLARTTPNVSGAYYNEIVVTHSYWQDLPIFTDIGVEQENMPAFSWNSGVVIVPAYDSQAEAGDTTINANLALTLGDISVISWVGQ